jgi:hypothetical protein
VDGPSGGRLGAVNRVQLTGRFATEVALRENERGHEASFIIEVDNGNEPQFFRVRCVGAAADAVESEAKERPFKGQPVSLVGSLRQVIVDDARGL